jgi:lysozyme family protein
MVASNFKDSLRRVLLHEGGYVNHPRDPGGPTNKGVTQRVYDGYRKGKSLPTQSVQHIQTTEIEDIYKKQYWDAVRGDNLPLGIDYAVFDFSVNSGTNRAIRFLQQTVNVTVDGQIGAITLAAVTSYPNHDLLIKIYIDKRLAFLKRLSTWPTFGKGWMSRVLNVLTVAQQQASGARTINEPRWNEQGARKANPTEAAPLPSVAPSDAVSGAGVATVTISQAVNSLTPLAGTSPSIDTFIAGLTVTGVALTVGGIAWRYFATLRKKKAEKELGN